MRLRAAAVPLALAIGLLLLIVSATQMTVSQVSANGLYGGYSAAYFENTNAPVTGCTSTCLATDTSMSTPSTYGGFPLTGGSTAYIWSTSFASAQAVPAGSIPLEIYVAGAPAGVVEYVPITLTNSQTASTPVNFQQELTVDWNTYSTYLASNVQNVEFFTIGWLPLYAWCESSCSSSAASSTVWLNLGSNTVAAGGTLTIVMAFYSTSTNNLSPTGYWGAYPSFTSTYGQYDNGAKVFLIYFNGDTPTSSFVVHTGYTLAQATGVTYGSGTINALEVTGGSSATKDAQIALSSGITQQGVVEEVNWEHTGSNNMGFLGLADSTNLGSIQNAIGSYVASTAMDYEYITGGTASTGSASTTLAANSWYYGTLTYGGPSATTFSVVGGSSLYSGTPTSVSHNPIGSATTLYFAPLSDHTGTSAVTYYYNWGRVRAYPPGGTMPSTIFGSASNVFAALSVSVYYTNSAGGGGILVGSGSTSAITTVETAYTVSIGFGSTFTIPAGGYLEFQVANPALETTTIYWGSGQWTNFQVSLLSGNAVP